MSFTYYWYRTARWYLYLVLVLQRYLVPVPEAGRCSEDDGYGLLYVVCCGLPVVGMGIGLLYFIQLTFAFNLKSETNLKAFY